MASNPLRRIEALGQSIWMDYISRGTLASGELLRWIEEDGVTGVTSNPSIFEKAIGESGDYDDDIRALASEGKSTDDIYHAVTVGDIQRAADLFRPVYDRREGADGFVSLEVSPLLAHDTAGTIADARRLWAALDRPNVMIKVPGTLEGLPAIQQLISEGINVNITLLFGLPRYRQVVEAYLAGLETRRARGEPLTTVASVASFFLSRIDALVDPMLENMLATTTSPAGVARSVYGQVAIASARAAYEISREVFDSERFRTLKAQGARTQRLLWASTSTKNPAFSELKYVEALIGPETIDTITRETLAAYRDHGNPVRRLNGVDGEAVATLQRLSEAGIDLDAVTRQLEDEGVQKFVRAFDVLMTTLDVRRSRTLKVPKSKSAHV
jgi:transaldolase